MNHIKWWLLIVAASIIIVYLIPQNINVSIDETLDRTQVEAIANDFITSSGYSLQDYRATVSRDAANFLLVYLNSCLEPDRFKELVNSDTIPDIRWQVQYLKNIPKDQPQTKYHVWISPRGKIVGYRRDLPDTLTIKLASGDTLVFYTDGFTEAMNPVQEEFGEERFVELISSNRNMSAQGLIEILVKTVEDFSEGAAQHDDTTVVVIKIL